MKIKFCGAARFVTGSCHLVALESGFTFLLDCGLFQGKGKDIWKWNNEWLFDPKRIDAVFLSHAHIDHCGRLPQLVKDGFKGKIYATHATRSLCAIMLLDSAMIQERDAEYFNRKERNKSNRPRAERKPLYSTKDVRLTMQFFVGCPYGLRIGIRKDLEVTFADAGHILGSASIVLKVKEKNQIKTLGYTGDIGRDDRPILRNPQKMEQVDYLLCESTYGDRIHESAPAEVEHFLNIVKQTCLEKKGKLIIPAFSVGRTQEIVYILDRLENESRLPHIPVFVDSPLSVNATQIYGSHPECYDNELNQYLLEDDNPFGFNALEYIREAERSKALNSDKRPMIIISSAGMMNAGRVKHHLYNNVEKKRNTFLIVGYCAPGTLGAQLRNGVREIQIFGDTKQVHADIEIMDSFSAHADRDEMLDFIDHQKSTCKTLFLVHGEEEVQYSFSKFLKDKGFKNVEVPAKDQDYTL
jgi:metallo-beta-lactamase family protein